MSELIRKPRASVDRRLVQAAILRLARYPATTSIGTVMRMVDEYAASQHTSRVYAHAERIVAEALVEAARAQEAGKKIFVCEEPEFHEKNFCCHSREKNFFIEDPGQGATMIQIEDDHGTKAGTKTKVGTNRARTVDVSTVTAVPDTSGGTTPVTDTEDTDTPVTDIGDSATDVGGKDALATEDGGKGVVATPATDTPDTGETDGAPTDDASPASADVDKATCESGKSEPEGASPDAAVIAVVGAVTDVKGCTQCGRELALSCYGRNRSRADGYASACKECETARDQRRKDARRKAQEGA